MDPYRIVVEERIRELLQWRRWYHANRWADWPDMERDDRTELRALVKLARKARRAAAPDPIDTYKSWTDAGWTTGELSEAFGR